MDAQHAAAIDIIRDYEEYLDFCFFENKYDICRLSYARCAAREIINRIKCENDISPLDSIELFKGKMLNFNNIHKRSIFDVGYETANDIIDLLMA